MEKKKMEWNAERVCVRKKISWKEVDKIFCILREENLILFREKTEELSKVLNEFMITFKFFFWDLLSTYFFIIDYFNFFFQFQTWIIFHKNLQLLSMKFLSKHLQSQVISSKKNCRCTIAKKITKTQNRKRSSMWNLNKHK